MNDHNSKNAYGRTIRQLRLNASLRGTKKGEVTPVAIRDEF